MSLRVDPDTTDGRLPMAFFRGRHNLLDLQTAVAFTTTDPAETAVLVAGQRITQWLGRYPSMVAADANPTAWRLEPRVTINACAGLFFGCVAESARRLWRRHGAGKTEAEHVAKDLDHGTRGDNVRRARILDRERALIPRQIRIAACIVER
jgi:hypothetical protein